VYDDGYGYYYSAGCIFNCFYNCPDQCQLLWWGDWFRYGDGYGWHCTLYLQLEYDANSNDCYGHGFGCGNLYGDHYGCGWLYNDRYGYYYSAGGILNCFYNCSDQCELLRRDNGISYGDGHRRHGSLYVQLEYDTCANGCYGYGFGSGYLYGDYYGWRRLYDDGYRYDHRTGCGAGCQHHGYDGCELLRRSDRICNGHRYGWHGSLYVWLEYDAGADGGHGYWFGCWYLYSDHRRRGWLYHNGHGYHY